MLRLRTTVAGVGMAAIGLTAIAFFGSAWAGALGSQSWAGYQADHQTFRRTAARWIVPAVNCSGARGEGDTESYTWVALGSGSSSTERVGVREFCTGRVAAYATFIGMNDKYEAQAVVPAPRDAVSASISYASGRYRFGLVDSTQGKSFSLAYSCGAFSQGQGVCNRSAAEVGDGIWAPKLSPLADYGTVTFSHVSITDGTGRQGSLAPNRHWGITKFSEFNGGKRAASATSLRHRGTGFADIWHHI